MVKVKESVTHQGIGGKEILIDEEVSKDLTKERVLELACSGNPACKNFMDRRDDFDYTFPYKLYYGKVADPDGTGIMFGYVVSEDELIFE